jgi:hypothetical protein
MLLHRTLSVALVLAIVACAHPDVLAQTKDQPKTKTASADTFKVYPTRYGDTKDGKLNVVFEVSAMIRNSRSKKCVISTKCCKEDGTLPVKFERLLVADLELNPTSDNYLGRAVITMPVETLTSLYGKDFKDLYVLVSVVESGTRKRVGSAEKPTKVGVPLSKDIVNTPLPTDAP